MNDDAGPHDAALRELVGYNIKRAMVTVQSDLARTLAPHDLRMVTFSALAVVAGAPGLRQSRLAEALAIEPPNMVSIVDELERRGLVRRAPAPDDRRALALMPTEAGLRTYRAAARDVREHDARMTAGLTDDERATLLAALAKIENRDPGSDGV